MWIAEILLDEKGCFWSKLLLPETWDFKRSLSKTRIGLNDVSEIDKMGRKGDKEKIGEEI